MKKSVNKLFVGIVVTVFLFFGAVAYAEEQQEFVSPESELYETVRLMEDTEYEYTEDNGEKALMQAEYAGKRLLEVSVMLEGRNEKAVAAILKAYDQHIQEVQQNLDEARINNQDISGIEAVLAEKFAKRSEKLTALLQREDLPQQAKDGISTALANQEKASQRFAEARQRASEAKEQAGEREIEAREQGEQRAIEARERAEERAEEAREKAEEIEARKQAEERARQEVQPPPNPGRSQ